MTDKAERMFKLLQDMKRCPCCEAGRMAFETFAADIFDFTAEAAFSCGARVQLHPGRGSVLRAADGCPSALVEKLDELELESDEAELDEGEAA